VVQVKKKPVHDAILRSAERLFSTRGYHATTLADIAGRSGIGVGSIYSYFPSKLAILYRIYRPWLMARLDELEGRIRRASSARGKLRLLLLGLWRDIPAQNTGLANSLMEALASADARQGKPDDLLRATEHRLAAWLQEIVPPRRRPVVDRDLMSHLLLMAYDGFVINRRLGDIRDADAMAELLCDMTLGPARPRGARPRRARQSTRSRKAA
jgi:AcrR family transcriptional regulator